jgi:23S rRNA G2069 N7-methylase RlmK/C1962 C5-methylase RlmI
LGLDHISTEIFRAGQHYLLRSKKAEGAVTAAVQSNAEMGDQINVLIIDKYRSYRHHEETKLLIWIPKQLIKLE